MKLQSTLLAVDQKEEQADYTGSTMQPVRETFATSDAVAKARLTKAWKAGKLPGVKRDYWSGGFFGRGYVQLTHKENYAKAGKALGIDLVSDPSKAMIPEIAAAILVRGMMEGWFTGKKLADYPNDFVESRRIVNGTDRAALIAGYAYQFLQAIETADKASRGPEHASVEPEASAARGAVGWAILILSAIGGIAAGAWAWVNATWDKVL
jgi:hypothetical protein